MKISDEGVKLITSFEGYHEKLPDGSCMAYRCIIGRDSKGRPIHDGKWTIGYGSTEGVTEGMIWTRAQAETAFREELARFEAAVNRLVKAPLTQPMFDALVSFAYNCGEGALASSTLLKKLNKGDIEGAAREFPKWKKSRGIVVKGLVRRRAAEVAMFLSMEHEASIVPEMPKAVEAPKPVSDAAKSSRTVFGVLTAFGASLVGLFQDTVAQMELLAPVKQIGSGLGVKAATIIFAITVAGLALALFARLDDAAKGKVVK